MVVTPSRSPRYIAILASVAALILVVGWLVRPRPIPQRPPPVPSEGELQQLARRAERRALEDMTEYFAGTARGLERSLAWIDGATGIAWNDGRIITSPLPGRMQSEPVRTSSALGAVETTATIAGPDLPLAVLAARDGSVPLPTVRRAASLPQVGDWVVAVWRNERAAVFAPSSFADVSSVRCGPISARAVVTSLPLTRAMTGGGVFNMDGELLGVILPCRDGIAAVDAAGIDAIAARGETLEERVLARAGMVLGQLSEEERRYFRNVAGLVVREVWIGSIADGLGIWPGDLVTAVNGRPVSVPIDVQTLASPSTDPIELRARRGAQALTFRIVPSAMRVTSPGGALDLGLELESTPRQFRIDSVTPGSRAAQAGVQAGDRLVRIDRTSPASVDQAKRALSARARAPLLLEILRDTRRIAIVLP